MFFDVLDVDALAGKPTLIAATGGTARHSLALEHALRPLFSYLRATVRPDRGVCRGRGLGLRGGAGRADGPGGGELAGLWSTGTAGGSCAAGRPRSSRSSGCCCRNAAIDEAAEKREARRPEELGWQRPLWQTRRNMSP